MSEDPGSEEPNQKLPHGGAEGGMPVPTLASLVEAYYTPLYRFALALTGCETEACELTQQALYIWTCKGHQLRDTSKAKVWLFTVLRREFLKNKRYQARFVSSETTLELTPAEEQVSTSAIDQLDGHIALKTLLDLDAVYREPLSLFYLQQHSYREIAKILDIPIGTVMSRISRGKLRLRKLLSGAREGNGEEERRA